MRKMNPALIFMLVILVYLQFGCRNESEIYEDHIYQTSTIRALLEGMYDGDTAYKSLKNRGNFGIGTFNGVDGEMIALDGEFFQIKSDGSVLPVADTMKTPFAVITHFDIDTSFHMNENLNYTQLSEYLDRLIPTPNLFYAIKISGEFEHITARSVPKQIKPYRKLAEVVEDQSIFDFEDIKGTILGFRFPDYSSEFNVPGYHLHFISEKKEKGGHILDCKGINGRISIDYIADILISLEENPSFYHLNLTGDKSEEIEKVEK